MWAGRVVLQSDRFLGEGDTCGHIVVLQCPFGRGEQMPGRQRRLVARGGLVGDLERIDIVSGRQHTGRLPGEGAPTACARSPPPSALAHVLTREVK